MIQVFLLLLKIPGFFAMVLIVGSTACADICVDSPDARVEDALSKYGYLEGASSNFLSYYINGCPAESIPEIFLGRIGGVLGDLDMGVHFANTLQNDASIDSVCGLSPETWLTGANTISFGESLCSLGDDLVAMQRDLSCATWRPVYRTIVYDGLCTKGIESLHFNAIMQFCIIFLCMIVVTFRVAFTNIENEKEDGDTDDENDSNPSTDDDGIPPATAKGLALPSKESRMVDL